MATELWHEIEVSPAFHDLDPMAVVWHGHYMKYFELSRCALLSKFDFDYPQMRESGFIWPIVDFHVKYVASAHYSQRLIIRAEIVEWENRLRINYRIRDALSNRTLTKASSIQVAVGIEDQTMCYVSPVILLQKLGVVEQ